MSASVLEIEPGAMRELHWHPHADEWQYYLEGAAEMAVYLGMGHTVTEQFVTGDVGYVPMGAGHYIRNTGERDLALADRIQQRALSFPRPQRMGSLESARRFGRQFRPATNGRGSASQGDALYRTTLPTDGLTAVAEAIIGRELPESPRNSTIRPPSGLPEQVRNPAQSSPQPTLKAARSLSDSESA